MVLRQLPIVWVCVFAGCSVDLAYPDAVRVICQSDSGCTSGTKCSVTAGVCIAANDPDQSPRITSATPTDSEHVVVLFSVAMADESLRRLTSYAVKPSIGVLGIDVNADRTRVTLQTTTQKARPYIVETTALVDDVGRPLADVQAQFTGIGAAIDDSAPTLLSPIDQTRVADRNVTLTWTANPDAASYTVEISLEEDLDPILLSANVTDGASYVAALPRDDTYYWRVTSDVTSVSSEVALFAAVADGLHVHCPDGWSCIEDLSVFRGGDPNHPLFDAGFAIALARTLGLSTIRVARRSENTDLPYVEPLLILGAAVTVEGGYDGSFARDLTRPSSFSTQSTTLRIAKADGTRLSGLRILGGATLTPAVDIVAANDVHLENLTISALVHDAQPLRIDTADVSLATVTVSGPSEADYSSYNEIAASVVQARDTHFLTRGIYVSDGANIELIDSEISATAFGTQTQTNAFEALSLHDSSVSVLRSRIAVDAAPVGRNVIVVDAQSSRFEARESRIWASRATIDPGCVFDCRGSIAISQSYGAVSLVDSVIVAKGPVGFVVDVIPPGSSLLEFQAYGSTFIAEDTSALLRFAVAQSGRIDLVNSVLMQSNAWTATCITLTGSAFPTTLVNNAFQSCVQVVTGYDDVASLNVLAATTGGHVAGNIEAAGDASVLFPSYAGADGTVGTADDVYIPVAHGPLDDAGAMSPTCGSLASPTVCPTSTTDIDSVARGSPPAIGAWEPK